MRKGNAKVLFLLDYGVSEAHGLRAVTALVDRGTAEVAGLFIEDEDLLKAAAVPGIAEISVHNQKVTRLDADSIQDALGRQARKARQLFETSADQLNMRHSFRIARGRLVETLLELAVAKDFVIVGRPLLAAGFRPRTGAQYTRLARTEQDVLFVNEPWETGSAVVVVVQGRDHDTASVLTKARAIADAEGLELVLAQPADAVDSRPPQANRVLSMDDINAESLVKLCAEHDARLLVVGSVEGIDWQDLLAGLLNQLSCSLLLLK